MEIELLTGSANDRSVISHGHRAHGHDDGHEMDAPVSDLGRVVRARGMKIEPHICGVVSGSSGGSVRLSRRLSTRQ